MVRGHINEDTYAPSSYLTVEMILHIYEHYVSVSPDTSHRKLMLLILTIKKRALLF